MFAGNLRGVTQTLPLLIYQDFELSFDARARDRRAARDRQRGRPDHRQAACRACPAGARGGERRVRPRAVRPGSSSGRGCDSNLHIPGIVTPLLMFFLGYWRWSDGSAESVGARCSRARESGRGAGVFALLGHGRGAGARGALRSPISRTCASCASAKRIAINWLTSWVNTPKAVDSSDDRRPDPRDPQPGAGALQPAGAAAQRHGARSTTTTPTRSRPARCGRSEHASNFALDLRGDAARYRHRRRGDDRRSRRVARPARSIVAGDGQHFSALSVLTGGLAAPGRRSAARSASKTAAISSPSSSPTRWQR